VSKTNVYMIMIPIS